ncbi:hypothetical protein QYF61_021545 [Mycteria americana]|uniref:Reverse transcriptase domain-containing protein n=1 Tax=Mycteria americana TaxID=33587 RepID=A0AAN7NFA6_MYCAM|nr:hypothetical protein QYF61_021545 [Mycteria americana]
MGASQGVGTLGSVTKCCRTREVLVDFEKEHKRWSRGTTVSLGYELLTHEFAEVLCERSCSSTEKACLRKETGTERNLPQEPACRVEEDQEEIDEAVLRQLQEASCSQALVLMGNFNHPDICWRDNTAGHMQSRRFQECIDDNFLTQVIKEPTGEVALLDLILTKKKGLVGDVKVRDNVGGNDQEMMDFRIPRGKSKTNSRITTLGFRRADFDLFRDLCGRITWDVVLERREAFSTVYHNILIDKLMKYEWRGRIVISSTKFSWRPVSSGVCQGSTLGPGSFKIFINNLDDGAECTLSKFVDDTELGGVVDRPDVCALQWGLYHVPEQVVPVIKRDLDRLEKWTDCLESSLGENDLGVLVNTKLTTSQ